MTPDRRRRLRPAALLAVAYLLSGLPWAVPGAWGGPDRAKAPCLEEAGATTPTGPVAEGAARLGPAPAAAQQGGPVTLRLDAEEGETLTYRFRSRTHVSPPPSMGMESTVDATMTVRQTVEAVEGDTLTVSSRIDSFSLDLSSDNQQVKSQLEQAAEESRKKVVGETFRLSMTRRGEIVEMGSIAQGAGPVQQLDRSIRSLAFATLPPEPVSVGDTWSGSRTADAGAFGVPVDGEVVTRSTSTLSRVLRRDGSRVAEISVESTFAFRADSAGAAAMKVDMEGSSAQTIHFDVDEGRFLSSTGAQDMTMNLTISGASQGSFTVQSTSETSANLVED